MPASAVKIANLQIEISDNSKTTVQSLTEFIDTLKSLKDATSNGAGLQSVATGLKNIKDVGSSGLNDLQKALTSSITPAEKLAHAMERIANANKALKGGSGLVNAARTANNLQRQIGLPDKERNTRAGLSGGDSVTTEETNSSLERTVSMLDKVKSGFASVGNFGKNVFEQILPSSLMTLGSQFLRLAKMKIMRTLISNLMQGFTQGLQNAYQWAKATGDQFALSMDTIATSMNYAKNSIGAAFSGVLNAVAPIIDRLVDWLVTGINYINAFFAALSGQSTYMRAKKVATAYGDVGNSIGGIGGSAGGATAKVKELEEQLSVLDFDELNQLQEQPTYNPTSGGGGGGGGGGAGSGGTNYADMFERVDIGENILKKVDWLKENFDTILDVAKAIGAAILGWKLANAFSNSIKELTGLQKLGIAMMVGGFTLEYEGAYNMGYEGVNLKNAIMTALGAALGIAGSVLTFGPMGLTFSIPVAIAIVAIGYAKGTFQRWIDDLKENSAQFQDTIQRIRQNSIELQTAIDMRNAAIHRMDKITKVNEDYDVGQSLLDQFKQISSQEVISDADLRKLQTIQDAFNELDLVPLKLQFELVNGQVHSNLEEIQKLLDAYRELALQAAYAEIAQESATAIAQADVGKRRAEQQYQIDHAQVTSSMTALKDMTGWSGSDIVALMSSMAGSGGNITPEQLFNMTGGVGAARSNGYSYEDVYDAVVQLFGDASAASLSKEAIQEYQKVIDDETANLNIALEALGEQIAETGQQAAEAAPKVKQYASQIKTSGALGMGVNVNGLNVQNWMEKNTPNSKLQAIMNANNQQMYAGMMGYGGTSKTTTNTAIYTTSGVEQATAQTQQYTSAVYDNNNALSLTHAYQDALSSGNIEMAEAIRRGSQAITDNTVAQQMSLPIMKLMYNGYSDLSNGMYQGVTAGRSYTNQMYASADAESAVGTASKSAGFQLSAFDKYLLSVGNTSNTTVRGVNLMNTGLYNIGTTSKTSSVNVGLINKALNAVGVGVDYGGIASLITTNLGRQRWVDTANKMKNPVESRFNLTGHDVNYKGIYSSMSSLMLKQPFGNMGTSMKGEIEATANQTGMGFASGSIYSRINTALGKQPFGTPGTNAKNSMEKTMNQTGAGLNAKNIYSVVQKKINSQPFGNLATPMKNNMEKVMNQIGSGFNVKAIYNTIAKGFDAQPWSQIGNRMGNDLRNGLQNVTNQIGDLPRSLCQAMQGAANNAPFSRVGNTIGNDIKQGIRQAVQNMSFDTVAKANGVTKNVQGSIRTELYASGGYPQSGSLFVAGEAGAEAVGTIGGRTAVANREQIASAIAQALRPMIGNRNESETIQVNTYLDSQVVARANAKGVKAMNRRYNITAKA